MATLEAMQPYVERLFEDADVQRQLARASANLRGAKARADRASSTKKALNDDALRRRLLESGRAALAAAVAIKEGPEKQRRRSRRGRLLGLLVLAAGGMIAFNQPARERVLGLVRGGSESAGEA
jgi:hypothetical protein